MIFLYFLFVAILFTTLHLTLYKNFFFYLPFFFTFIFFSTFFFLFWSYSDYFSFANFSTSLNVFWPFIFIFLLVTPLTLLYTFFYSKSDLLFFFFFCWFIFFSGLIIFFINSLIFFFLLYESFLIPSFLVLYNYAKTRKAVEAAFLMFFWTQFGALFLIFNFQYLFYLVKSDSLTSLYFVSLSKFEMHVLFISVLIGFGVKFPVWPFYEWLPKAHVEASTNFSIFLSGVLVKFAFFAFLKYISFFYFNLSFFLLYPFFLFGIFDSLLKIIYQVDLKKLIAYATVMEMHWLSIAVVSGHSCFWLAAFASLIAHALISTNFFIFIDSVTRRFKTRLTSEIAGLFYFYPNIYFLILINLLIFLGFPGTLFFFAEFIFFFILLELNFYLFILLFLIAYFYLPTVFFKKWFLLLYGWSFDIFFLRPDLNLSGLDASRLELLFFSFFTFFLFWFGFTFHFFF